MTPLEKGHRMKMAQFTNVDPECVFEAIDQACLYEVPLALEEEGLVACPWLQKFVLRFTLNGILEEFRRHQRLRNSANSTSHKRRV